MSDPVGDWYEWKRKEAEKSREVVNRLKARLADASLTKQQRYELQERLRKAEQRYEVDAYVGD